MRYLLRLAAIILCTAGVSGVALPPPVAAQVFTEPAKPAAKKSRKRAPAVSPARRSTSQRAARAEVPAAPPPPTFAEPDAYCAANSFAAGPGPELAAEIPLWVTNGWKRASSNTQSTRAFALQWKCSGGKVLACGTPIGRDWCAKPADHVAPTQEMAAYCADKRKGTIPREITGNTFAVWVCKSRKPALSGFRNDLDPDGFLIDTWRDVTPFSPENMIGDVPKAYIANWAVPVKVGVFGSMIRSGNLTTDFNPTSTVTTFSAMQIDGGLLGMVIGTNVYYGESPGRGVAPTGCEAKLILSDATMTSITVTERYLLPQPRCRKPETFVLQARDGQLLVNWMAKGKTKPKRSEWVQAFQ